MTKLRILSIATVVAAAVAFPAVAAATVAPGTYPSMVNPANAPSGTHFGNGSTAPTCTVGADLSVTCGDGAGSTQSYTLQGVGHTDATLNLVASYTETVTCTNGGRQLVVAQGKTEQASGTPQTIKSSKNGSMTVPSASVSAPATVGESGSGSPCPNRNWTWTVSSLTLNSYDYTLTFAGFSSPFISNSQSDPS